MESGHKQLLEKLIDEGVLVTPEIINAFEQVDRKDFVPAAYVDDAYDDHPLSIGGGQTISQPYTVACMLELLAPRAGEKILDVGSGSGWTTALLAHVVGERGRVFGTEIRPELVEFGQENLSKYNFERAEIRDSAGTLGLPSEAPFDKILTSAASQDLPDSLVAQLKVGGVLVIPVGSAIWKVVRTGNATAESERHEGFAFVPLIEE